MTSLQQHEYLFELVHDSVMMRSVEGRINFWNHSAEELYGWRKEEAIGRVSHNLLQTQFPKPLEEIESELVRNGIWEGKLVHTTRHGDRVVVESRWTLDLKGQSGAVVEANTPSVSFRSSISAEPTLLARGKRHRVGPRKLSKEERLPKIANVLLAGGALLCMIAVLIYGLFGHQIIDAIYTSPPNQIIDSVVHRDVTPLTNYFREADRRMAEISIKAFTLGLLLFFLLKEPLGFALTAISVVLFSFVMFGVIELFPSMTRLFRLDQISSYYAYKANYIYDDELVFREVPFRNIKVSNFRGDHYSPLLGVDVPPVDVEWITDRQGFRNSIQADHADVIVLGDSFMEWGNKEADTFTKRLEGKLSELTVVNLAKAGYGPFQYLEVIKRFGLRLKPKYALLAIYAGNDFTDTERYLRWKKEGIAAWNDLVYRLPKAGLLERYWIATTSTLSGPLRGIELGFRVILQNIAEAKGYDYGIHPTISMLNLGNNNYEKILFVDSEPIQTKGSLLESEVGREMRRIIGDIRDICQRNGIVPVIIYIPTAARVYEKYSTDQSRTNELAFKFQQIVAGDERENTVRQLAEQANIPFVTLARPFEAAAKEGKLVYHSLDSHWNSEGRELAATYAADTLRAMAISSIEEQTIEP